MTSLDEPLQTSNTLLAQASYDPASYISAFEQQYQREFGFRLTRPVLVDDLRVRATGKSQSLEKTKGQAGTPGESASGGEWVFGQKPSCSDMFAGISQLSQWF